MDSVEFSSKDLSSRSENMNLSDNVSMELTKNASMSENVFHSVSVYLTAIRFSKLKFLVITWPSMCIKSDSFGYFDSLKDSRKQILDAVSLVLLGFNCFRKY